jgi:NCAIR mutase (PurE)-related protein
MGAGVVDFDVGVAGIHRLCNRLGTPPAGRVLIVVAGMEAALPSVVGGLVAFPSSPFRPASDTGRVSAGSPPFSPC